MITIDIYATLVSVSMVLLFGLFLVSTIKSLRDYSIPEPVVDGLVAAWAILVTFPVMGRGYDAMVIAAGHCRFGLGATGHRRIPCR